MTSDSFTEEVIQSVDYIMDQSNGCNGKSYFSDSVEVNVYFDHIELEFLEDVSMNHMLNVAKNIIIGLQEGPLESYIDPLFNLRVRDRDKMIFILWLDYSTER